MVDQLQQAYLRKDEGIISRIYAYAKWCADAPRGKDASDDLFTIVAVSFFEHLPEHELIRRDLGHRLPKKEIEGMKEIFLYHGTEEQFQEILNSCTVIKNYPYKAGNRR